MAFRRTDDDDLAGEDPLAEEPVGDEDEEEGEDLFGENMAADYEERPELDHYDPSMLDDAEHEPMTIEERLAAERALNARDLREGRRGPESAAPSSPTILTDRDDLTPAPKRRRTQAARPAQAAPGVAPDDEDPEEPDAEDEEVPEAYYDLTHEQLGEEAVMEKRLEQKIRRSFQQFLLRFIPEGQSEPRYPDELKKMAEEHQRHLDVSFTHLQQWSANLALWIAESPEAILPILNETLMSEAERKFGTYGLIKETGETELRVAIHSFPIREPIRELCTKHLGKLVCLHGVVTKRTGVFNQVKKLYLRCAKCGFPSGPFMVAEEKDLKPGSCIECQSRGPWRVDRQSTLYRNYQKVTLQESPSSVEPGKMPRSKDVILVGDMVDTVRPGDELYLTGIYRCLYDAATNARTCFPVYRTQVDAVHIKRKFDEKSTHLTEEQLQQIRELAEKPNIRERFIASIAPSIYGMHEVKRAISLSIMGGKRKEAAGKHRIRGDINVLLVGDPGLAKSQFLKYVEQTVPRAVYTTGKGASAVGLTAAVTRDEHGDWCLEGGAMVLADNGTCLIDEFDKMNDQDRTSIHEAMEQQSISISKAGIVAQLQARCAVMAVANPVEGRYDPQRTFAQNVNLSDPILSRFDVLCVLRDESDPLRDEQLADHVICSHIRSHPEATSDEKLVQPKLQQKASHVEPIPQDLLQKYIAYARQNVEPKLADVDYEKISSFYMEIRAEAFRSGGAPMTARHVDSIVRLAEASAKLELRNHVTSRDVDFAIQVMLESFIMSQKHQVAEEMRHKFRRYLVQSTPLADLIMNLLEKMFKEKVEQVQLARPGITGSELANVSIDMAQLVLQLERNDIELEGAHNFMRSPRFHQNFRVEGERIFRILS